jgi:hypothetical protein
VNTGDHHLIQYIHQLLCHEIFDDSVLGNLIDNETIPLLEYVFDPLETALSHLIVSHWTVDWDVATIIEAAEKLHPLQAEHTMAASDRQLYSQGPDPIGQHGASASGYYP